MVLGGKIPETGGFAGGAGVDGIDGGVNPGNPGGWLTVAAGSGGIGGA